MKLVNLLLAVAVIAAAYSASAAVIQDTLLIGNPSYGGAGCPAGSASVTLSPDQKSLSILFDQFTVEAGGMTGKRVDRKACNIAIPVHVPQGLSISIIAIDYRGFNSLPSGAQSQFNVEYFFAGGMGPRFSKRFIGSLNEDFLVNNTLIATGLVWSACGADVNLRTNTSMMVQSNRYGEQALSSVDSMDLQAGVIYQIQWRKCTGY